MSRTVRSRSWRVAVVLAFVMVSLAACSGSGSGSGSSPVTPTTPPVVVAPPSANPLLSDPRFDLTFYRMFALNNLNAGITLQRWTQAPHVYIRTIREDGVPVDPAILAVVTRVVGEAIPQWSGGNYAAAEIQQGIGNMEAVAGWITVRWPGTVAAENACGGTPIIGGNFVHLYTPSAGYDCGCGNGKFAPLTVRHEFGHAMGYWHTDNPNDVMWPTHNGQCDPALSAREAFHARVAYSEPVGSGDPK